MDSLKFIFGLLLFVLCAGIIGVLIWIMLFGIPKSAMDGGTLVQALDLPVFPQGSVREILGKAFLCGWTNLVNFIG